MFVSLNIHSPTTTSVAYILKHLLRVTPNIRLITRWCTAKNTKYEGWRAIKTTEDPGKSSIYICLENTSQIFTAPNVTQQP